MTDQIHYLPRFAPSCASPTNRIYMPREVKREPHLLAITTVFYTEIEARISSIDCVGLFDRIAKTGHS